ncbi:response regulator [Salmonella enterica subsp. enterica]|nr:response regulator [Salmonella enterica subsp. enterica]
MLKKSRCLFAVIPALLSGCTATPVSTPPATTAAVAPAPAEVVHTARYTLISLTPDEALRFPLRQIASHTLSAPTKKQPLLTRGDALKTWLGGTGYGLCLPVTNDIKQMFASPLPDVQRSPGPLRIENALQLIAGTAWELTTDEVTRTVCFSRLTLS